MPGPGEHILTYAEGTLLTRLIALPFGGIRTRTTLLASIPSTAVVVFSSLAPLGAKEKLS